MNLTCSDNPKIGQADKIRRYISGRCNRFKCIQLHKSTDSVILEKESNAKLNYSVTGSMEKQA